MHTIERKVEIPNNHLALPNIRKLTILLTSRGEFEVHSTNLWGLGKKYNVIQSCLYVYIYPAIMWNTKGQMKLSHFEGNPVVQGNWSNFFNAFFFFFLPNIKMNLPQVYMCSPSWTLLPPPSPYHPSGSSQCTSPKHPVSCIEPGLAIRFLHDILHVSMSFSQIFPPSPSPTESIRLFSIRQWHVREEGKDYSREIFKKMLKSHDSHMQWVDCFGVFWEKND